MGAAGAKFLVPSVEFVPDRAALSLVLKYYPSLNSADPRPRSSYSLSLTIHCQINSPFCFTLSSCRKKGQTNNKTQYCNVRFFFFAKQSRFDAPCSTQWDMFLPPLTFTPLFSNSDSITMHLLPERLYFVLQKKDQKGAFGEKTHIAAPGQLSQ